MTETLLSLSNVLLFGRKVEDLQIITPNIIPIIRNVKAATTLDVPLQGIGGLIDGVPLDEVGLKVLVKRQSDETTNGIYVVGPAPDFMWSRADFANETDDFREAIFVRVRKGDMHRGQIWRATTGAQVGIDPIQFEFVPPDAATFPGSRHGPFREPRRGIRSDLENQLTALDFNNSDLRPACFARIYGFSFESTYYELPKPVLFLVHGDGYPVTEVRSGVMNVVRRARGIGDPSLTGLSAADFQFAEDLKVWSYDKADYSIRMDVETGMLEDILLDPTLGGGGGGLVVGGARVSGARVSGARVSGARVSGARLSGGRGDAGD